MFVSSSPFNYGSAGHVISSDFNKVIDGLKSHILKGQKFRNTDMASLFHKLHIMISIDEYAKRWAKHE